MANLVSLTDYQLRLPSFEGPLDVLLRLIERDRLDVTDVSLVAVADGFTAHLATLGAAPPSLLAEFAAVAGRLLLLKSRSLLPRPAVEADEPEPSDLARQLAEYRRLKDASAELAERERRGLSAFGRGPSVAIPDRAPRHLAAHAPGLLVRALRRRLSTSATPTGVAALQPVLTVGEMVGRFARAFRAGRVVSFHAVRHDWRDREETIVAFLSLLLLIRRRVVDADQPDRFGAIAVRLRPERDPGELEAGLAGEWGDDEA